MDDTQAVSSPKQRVNADLEGSLAEMFDQVVTMTGLKGADIVRQALREFLPVAIKRGGVTVTRIKGEAA